MSRRNRPSSLPSSLIPHLYTGPQRDSFARTTLPDNDADDDAEPLHLRPLEEDFDEHSLHPVDHTLQRFHLYDQPYSRYSEPGPSTRREIYFPDPERHELPHRPYHAQDYSQAGPYLYRDRPPVNPYTPIQRSGPRFEYPSRSERPEYLFSPRPESTGAGPSSISDYPAGPSSVPASTPHSAGTDDNDSEYTPSQASRKRRLSTDSAVATTPKRTTKKTLIACDFCRGRKLRCDGIRPSCMNCISRDNQPCVYQPHARRRGPGKAPRGSRGSSKKKLPGRTRSSSNTSQYPTTEYGRSIPPLPTPDPFHPLLKQEDQDLHSAPRRPLKRSSSDEGT